MIEIVAVTVAKTRACGCHGIVAGRTEGAVEPGHDGCPSGCRTYCSFGPHNRGIAAGKGSGAFASSLRVHWPPYGRDLIRTTDASSSRKKLTWMRL